MRADLFSEREDWKMPMAISAALHLLFAVFVVIAGYISGPRGQMWGGETTGSSVTATLVSSIPLPHPQVTSDNIVASESKGQTESVPKPPVEDKPEAVPIPENTPKHKVDRNPVTPTHDKPLPTPVPQDNRVPFGQGGAISGPFATFAAANAKGGISAQGGDFGSRFAWYVQAVSTKVSNNWYTIEIGPNVGPHRVWVTFDIQRDGTPANVRIEQSSGVPSLDQSTLRAVQRIDTFGPLPPGYSGSKVSVEFWFDYQR
ncbi:MAG TPA: TonB family protein [Candidatus Angelobacter sp.]|nr:TonB family protein [Candidatus Angelobacter sp.]